MRQTQEPHRESSSLNTAPISTDSQDLKSVWVIIPALNEEASIPLVLGDLSFDTACNTSDRGVGRVVVVDNGSTDQTAEISREYGATVVTEPKRGYGSACLRGLAFVEEEIAKGAKAPEIIVFVDADYSDHPDLLPRLTQPIVDEEQDFVLGSRLLGERERGAMPLQSVYGNKLACWLMRILFGANFTDLGPFRAIRYKSLQEIGMVDTNFGWTIEMQIKAVRANLRYLEIPVPYRCRIGTSKISGTLSGTVRAGSKILATIARYGLSSRK